MIRAKLLIILFLFIGCADIKAQNYTGSCFENCDGRLSLLSSPNRKIYKVGDTLETGALEAGDKIIQQLKGCYFPNFPLQRVFAGQDSISIYKGSIVVIYFNGIGCGETCETAFPIMNELITEFKERKVIFINIFTGSVDEAKSNLKTVSSNAIQYADSDREKFCIIGYPFGMILNKEGKVLETIGAAGYSDASKREYHDIIKHIIESNL